MPVDELSSVYYDFKALNMQTIPKSHCPDLTQVFGITLFCTVLAYFHITYISTTVYEL